MTCLIEKGVWSLLGNWLGLDIRPVNAVLALTLSPNPLVTSVVGLVTDIKWLATYERFDCCCFMLASEVLI